MIMVSSDVLILWDSEQEGFQVHGQNNEHDQWLASNAAEYSGFTPLIRSKDLLSNYLVWLCQRGETAKVSRG